MEALRSAANSTFRVITLLMLSFWVFTWPFLIMALVTIDHQDHAAWISGLFIVQAVASLACVSALFFWVEKRWFWWVAGLVALWLPAAILLESLL